MGERMVIPANSRRLSDGPQGSVDGVGGPAPERSAAVMRRAVIDAIARRPVWTDGVMVMTASTKPRGRRSFCRLGAS